MHIITKLIYFGFSTLELWNIISEYFSELVIWPILTNCTLSAKCMCHGYSLIYLRQFWGRIQLKLPNVYLREAVVSISNELQYIKLHAGQLNAIQAMQWFSCLSIVKSIQWSICNKYGIEKLVLMMSSLQTKTTFLSVKGDWLDNNRWTSMIQNLE